jgi:hypothetical protein
MADLPKTAGDAGPEPGVGEVSAGRRRLLRAGASVPPVVMTVISRPVMALGCDSPSGFTSINVSHPGPGTCTGKSPTSWTSNKANWPAPYNAGPTADPTFKSIFGANVPSGTSFDPNNKLSQVMSHPTAAPWGLAQYIIAAYFNASTAAYGTSTLLSQLTVVNIWSDYSKSANGTYSPRSGASWNYLEICEYLKTTMPN